ncbi:MAG TPA: DUF6351 family protein [Gammaproteobacteria bacterium]|jgi:hypothetical protein|nr:DUF6351 family protein [Gammaproteobacteria bacterium]
MKSLKPASLIILLAFLISACSPDQYESSADGFMALNALSNQSHLVSGGDVLVEVVTSVADGQNLELRHNGSPVATQLNKVDSSGGLFVYQTLVTGLRQGVNLLRVEGENAAADLTVVNYPSTGPIFSGPYQEPYLCLSEITPGRDGEKRRFAIGNGEFLDDSATDENCSLDGRVDYVYHSTDTEVGFKALIDLTSRPQDLAFTTTNEGQEVPYIVRIETGTINRAIYQIAILHDPQTAVLSALSPSLQWNGRLVYTFGGGCEAGYFQANSTAGVLRDNMLGRGYAVASSTLNVNAQGGCNDVLSAETAMMVKEHFIESYGEPRYTIGNGGSGGAMQQLHIAGAYPGILDGLLPSMTFADSVSYFTDSQECESLLRDYVNDPDKALSEETKAILGGWSMWSVCDQSLGQRPKRVGPGDCSAQIPEAARYNPATNPEGIRCSIYDGMKNIFGEKLYPEIGVNREFARVPHDNIGVQYGLAALNEGLISKELFLDLNENIGGWDIDVNSQPERTEADDDAVRIAYETGRITSGGAGLAQVPIIDDRSYLDDIGNFHASVYSFVTRARLQRDNGHADNFVLRRHNSEMNLADDNLALMDQWLANIQADTSPADTMSKIVRAKPADLQNDCFAENGERIVEEPNFNPDKLFDNTEGSCNRLYPPHAGLRLVAGGPLTNDVLKCQLKAIDFDDYKVKFTDEEKSQLRSIFSEGICDWSKPGVHQQVNKTWLSFGPSPVNRY